MENFIVCDVELFGVMPFYSDLTPYNIEPSDSRSNGMDRLYIFRRRDASS